ncbi:hypothetical protein [Rhodococcus sp. H29-C3]|uniref:hypothetical protein n=1 Tax=Rhodococcus sp. H29-C3 TaxID=3046307 RepID=UPI0024BB3BA1|nr:hypothetical protein [Rhodococcus sp. H29-C3]MDJ0361541.1 hypothetical protein [Rhodococcus sp. H29-C3]
MATSNRYQPAVLHQAWAARAALCVSTNDQAAMALLLDQVTASGDCGVNELVTAQAALLCDVLETAGALGNLAAWAEDMQAAANYTEGGNDGAPR